MSGSSPHRSSPAVGEPMDVEDEEQEGEFSSSD
jgi:hypothetical protein